MNNWQSIVLISIPVLLLIILKKIIMAQETLDALMAKATAAETSLTNIKADITKIKEGLPTTGGLTADEVATLSSKLDALAGSADALDKENE
jgi:hypothetical protein